MVRGVLVEKIMTNCFEILANVAIFGQLLLIFVYKVTFSKIETDLINGPRCNF